MFELPEEVCVGVEAVPDNAGELESEPAILILSNQRRIQILKNE